MMMKSSSINCFLISMIIQVLILKMIPKLVSNFLTVSSYTNMPLWTKHCLQNISEKICFILMGLFSKVRQAMLTIAGMQMMMTLMMVTSNTMYHYSCPLATI